MTGDFDHSIVESTAHRPWPVPRTPWLMTQSWHDLLFAHWRVDEDVVTSPSFSDLASPWTQRQFSESYCFRKYASNPATSSSGKVRNPQSLALQP
jgi:hypothetical protein